METPPIPSALKRIWLTASLLFLTIYGIAQQHTVTAYAPKNAYAGETITISGTNLTGVTGISFGGTPVTSYNIVSATSITAVVGAGSTGSMVVSKTGYTDVTVTGFTYSTYPTVSRIITDFGGFWNTNTTLNNGTYPNDAHHLLAFTYSGVTYSTGVNDASLINNGVTFTAGNYKSLPAVLNGTTFGGSLYIVAASKIDGNNAAAIYTHPNIRDLTIQNVLTDGTNGLNLGTGYTNLPVGATSNFSIRSIAPSKIADNEPDIIITQIADPTGTATDSYKFVDGAGNTIGNAVQQDISKLSALGTYYLDLFSVTVGIPFSIAKPIVGSQSNVTRQLRFIAFKLSDFGIDASNYSQIQNLQVIPSGVTDVAFVAYNASAINVPPSVAQNSVSTNSVICSSGGGPAFLSVNATAAAGGNLSYDWECSIDGGSSWSPVTDGGVYSGATTNSLTISSATAGYQYHCNVTESGSEYTAPSAVFTITSAASTSLSGTLQPTALTLCLNANSGITNMSVSPTGGTGTYNYQWSVSTESAGTYTDIPGAIYNNYNPPLNVAGILYYKVRITSGCVSNLSAATAVTITGDQINSVTNGSTCTTGTVALSASASGGTISWYNAATAGTLLGTGNSYTTPSISSTTTYYASTTTGGCTSLRVPVVATVTNTIALSSSNFNLTNATNICAGSSTRVTVTSSVLPDGNYTINYAISGANTVAGGTSAITITGGIGSFNTSALSNAGSNTITVTGVVSGVCTLTPASGNTISFSVTAGAPSVSNFSVAVTDGCTNSSSVVTINSSSLSSGTYIVQYAVSGTNTIASTTAQMNFTAGSPGSGSFSLPYLSTPGSTNKISISSIALLSSPTCTSALSVESSDFSTNNTVIVETPASLTICGASAANITSESNAFNYNNLVWSTSNGTGSFGNNTSGEALSTTTYTASAADISRGWVYLTLTATGQNGCANVAHTITATINAATVGGTVSSNQDINVNTQPANLVLTGYTGTIVRWEKAGANTFTSPSTIAITNATLTGVNIGNLSSSTYFRAVLKNGSCPTEYSSAVFVNVWGALAVKFQSVSGQATPAGAVINWQVHNDDKVVEYVVEKSVDGLRFDARAQVSANKQSSNNGYTWKENTYTEGNYYRIKAIEENGDAFYSTILFINTVSDKREISLFPGSVHTGEALFMRLLNTPVGVYQIQIMGLRGEIIARQELSVTSPSGVHKINVPGSMVKGIYVIKVIGPESIRQTLRFIQN